MYSRRNTKKFVSIFPFWMEINVSIINFLLMYILEQGGTPQYNSDTILFKE